MITTKQIPETVSHKTEKQPERIRHNFYRVESRSIAPRRPRIALIIVGILLGAVIAISAFSDLPAMPPHPSLIDKVKRGAIEEPFYMKNLPSLRKAGINMPDGKHPAFKIQQLQSWQGDIKVIALVVDFPDANSSASAAFFDTLIYLGNTGSVNDFYKEVSYDGMNIITSNLPSSSGWIRLPQTLAYYTNGNNGLGSYPQNCQKMVEDAVDLADSFIDFSEYDNDGDGYVDGLIVVHSGRGAEYTGNGGDIWSHKWAITPRPVDGVYVYNYSTMPEYWVSVGDMTIGVYCHELGHVFGLPDLYDTDYSSKGVGDWSLMAGGSWNGVLGNSPAHFDAWCRVQLGFAAVDTVIANANSVQIPAIELEPVVFRLWKDGAGGNEYFLVENRRKIGYDSALPGQGLLIWHIDDSRSNNNSEWYPGHTGSGHYEVALEQADGLWDLEEYSDDGDSGDPYPGLTGNTAFSSGTTPSSMDYSNASTNVVIDNISTSADTAYADFEVFFVSGIDELDEAYKSQMPYLAQNYPNPFNATCRITYYIPEADYINLSVFNLRGEEVANLVDDNIEAGIHQIFWDGKNKFGEQVASGYYFYTLRSMNNRLDRKMVLLK